LALGGIDFAQGYDKAGQLGFLRDAIKWGTDYFIKVVTHFPYQNEKHFPKFLAIVFEIVSATMLTTNCTFKWETQRLIIIHGKPLNPGRSLGQLTKSLSPDLALILLEKLPLHLPQHQFYSRELMMAIHKI
jgi:hypothetical protein